MPVYDIGSAVGGVFRAIKEYQGIDGVSLCLFDSYDDDMIVILPRWTSCGSGRSTCAKILKRIASHGNPDVITKRVQRIAEELFPGIEAVEVGVLPLVYENGLIGTLNIASLRESKIQRENLESLVEHADLLGDVLSGRGSLERKRDIQLDLINRLGRQNILKKQLEEFLDMAVVSIRENLNYYNVSLFMLDESGKNLVLTAHTGSYRGIVRRGHRQSLGVGMLGWAARNGKTLLANDVSKEPTYVVVNGLKTGSEICVPVVVDEKVIGVLNVESDRTSAFDQGDVKALETLSGQLADAIKMQKNHRDLSLIKRELGERYNVDNIIGTSEEMLKVLNLVKVVSQSDTTVIIRGETGTGKNLIAKAIHLGSDRHDSPFVSLNCAAIPDSLFESELFGHEKGAFTGADRKRIGKIKLTDGGTLFLDEVGDIPYAMQIKLLRVIEEKVFTRVGGEDEIKADVRIISASSLPLEELEREGSFRKDLYFRLNVVPIHLPPLRERIEDVPLLAYHFLTKACGKLNKDIRHIEPDILSDMASHQWPGNVRELENLIERAVLMQKGSSLTHIEIPSRKTQKMGGIDTVTIDDSLPLDEVKERAIAEIEGEYLRKVLTRCKGNISLAAKMAGMNRRTMYNKMEKYNIRRRDSLASP